MNEVSQIQARIAELEALRDYADEIGDCFRADLLHEVISVLTAELYDQDVAH